MNTEKDLAVLALHVYRADPTDENAPLLPGWEILQNRTEGSFSFG